MNHRHVLSSALATALALGLAGPAAAEAKPKEKCYGISKAGTNDCGISTTATGATCPRAPAARSRA